MIGNTGQQSNLSQWAMNTNPGANSHSHPLGSYNSPTNVGIYYPQAPDSSRGRRVQAPSNHRSYTQVWIDPQRVPEAPHNAMRRVEQPGRTQIRQLQGHGASQRQTNSMPQPSVPPPTNLKETDYCPICTRILPPPHPDTGDETEREEHIQRCIAEQTSVSPRRGQGNRGSTSFGSTPGDDGSPRSSARNGRAMERAEAARRVGPSRGGVRSVSYVATENDTWDYNVDSDGEINDGPEGDDELDAAPGEIFLIGNENMKHQGAAIEDDDDVIITYSNIPEPPQTKSKVKQKTHKKKEKVRKKAECVICFGEFEAGEVISRLDCLCRYHKVSPSPVSMPRSHSFDIQLTTSLCSNRSVSKTGGRQKMETGNALYMRSEIELSSKTTLCYFGGNSN